MIGTDSSIACGSNSDIFSLLVMNQVVVGSFLTGNQHEQKHKKQKHNFVSIATPTAAVPISSAEPWTSLPSDSRDKPTDINVFLPGVQHN